MTIDWKEYEVDSLETAKAIIREYSDLIAASKIIVAGFDTETSGLNPVLDKPFLFQCGWVDTEHKGVTIVLDIEQQEWMVTWWFITQWHKNCKRVYRYVGHHIVFDLHMMTNIGLPYTGDNVTDTQFYIRASSDAIQTDQGGEPLALKDWAVRHISRDANSFEKELKEERTAIAKKYNAALQKRTGWKKGVFNEFFKDKLNDWTDLPDEVRDKYKEWHDELPEYLQRIVTGTVESDMIRYNDLNRDNVKKYGHLDVMYTLTCYMLCKEVIDVRDNWELVRRENQQIYPLLRMERVGLKVNASYVTEARRATKEYILQRRKDLNNLAMTEDLSVGQHARIKDILKEVFAVEVESTGQEFLEQTVSNLKREGGNEDAIEFIETVLELRTLEKWYSTYIKRFHAELDRTDTIYTSIHQVGAVSGRVSCDFQQFPKAGLVTIDGTELFSPRTMVVCDKEYPAIVYLDYSQIELRLQALYTYLIGHPDLNLCRAYSPFKCHRADGTPYNPEKDMAQAYVGKWYQDEDNKEWVPTDVHGATTEKAFHITPDDPRFHELRYVGKRVNFAKNYGAGPQRIAQMFPNYDMDTILEIDAAYYKAFPGVKEYHEACFNWAGFPWMDNLFGVKYYGVSGHKLRNVLVQGTGAYFLKEKIALVDKYLQDNKCKSVFMMQIHDELQFKWHKDDDPKIFFDIKKIMEDSPLPIPIVADMEITTTTWKDKKEVESLEEVYEICNWH